MSIVFHTGYGYSKKLCEDITSWFLNEFFPRHKITVEIVHRGLKRENVFGYCDALDGGYHPREFLIELQTHMDRELYAKTLIHELYHCYQHVKGDLIDKGGTRLWRGIDCSNLEYEEMPWEIEAHEQEEILYQLYMNDYDTRTKVSTTL